MVGRLAGRCECGTSSDSPRYGLCLGCGPPHKLWSSWFCDCRDYGRYFWRRSIYNPWAHKCHCSFTFWRLCGHWADSSRWNGFLGCIAFASMDFNYLCSIFNTRKCSKNFVHDSVHFPDCNYCLCYRSLLLDHSQSMQAPSWSSKFFK